MKSQLNSLVKTNLQKTVGSFGVSVVEKNDTSRIDQAFLQKHMNVDGPMGNQK